MFPAASMSSNHVPSLDVENVLHLFGFVLILQRFSSFFHLPTSDSTSDNLRFPSCRLAEAMFPAASMTSNHFPSLDVENVLYLFCFVMIPQRFSSLGLALGMEQNLPNWMTLFSVSVKCCAQR